MAEAGATEFEEVEGIGSEAFDVGLHEVDRHVVPEWDDGCLIDHELVHPAVYGVSEAIVGFEEGGFVESVEFGDACAGVVGGGWIFAVEHTEIIFSVGVVSDPAAAEEEGLVAGDPFEEAGALHGFDFYRDANFLHLTGDEGAELRVDGDGVEGDRLEAASAGVSGLCKQTTGCFWIVGMAKWAMLVEARQSEGHEAVFCRKSDGISQVEHHFPAVDRVAHGQPDFQMSQRG